MIDLGTLGGSSGHVFAMNDAGDVAGNSYLPGVEVRHAVLWRRGKIIDLGTIGDDPCSDAHGMNIRDQVVGSSDDCVDRELHGFLWQPGGSMIDLNAFVPPGSDLTITDGHTINDRGEITASGMLPNGDFHAVLLIPCDEAQSVDGCREAGDETNSVQSKTSLFQSVSTKRQPPGLENARAAFEKTYWRYRGFYMWRLK